VEVRDWFKKMEVFDANGAVVGFQPVGGWCMPCGLGLESHVVSPDNVEEQIERVVKLVKSNRQAMGEFLIATEYLMDPNKKREWNYVVVKSATVSGFRLQAVLALVTKALRRTAMANLDDGRCVVGGCWAGETPKDPDFHKRCSTDVSQRVQPKCLWSENGYLVF